MLRAIKVFVAFCLLVASSMQVHAQQVSAPFPSKQSALSTTVKTIKATKGVLAWGQCYNTVATVIYIQVFDTTAAVTLGTTVPNASFGIAASGPTNLPLPMQFNKAIKVAATTTVGGNTAPGTAVDCNFGFN